MGYQLNRQSSSLWNVVDDEGRSLFEGNLTACQEWLDQQEAASQKSWFESLVGFFQKRSSNKQELSKDASTADSQASFRITG